MLWNRTTPRSISTLDQVVSVFFNPFLAAEESREVIVALFRDSDPHGRGRAWKR